MPGQWLAAVGGLVFGTVMGTVYALLGGVLGVGMGCLFIQAMHTIIPQFFPFPIHEMLGPWLAYMLLTAAGIGLVSGLVPAVRAAQLSVVNGLRQVV